MPETVHFSEEQSLNIMLVNRTHPLVTEIRVSHDVQAFKRILRLYAVVAFQETVRFSLAAIRSMWFLS